MEPPINIFSGSSSSLGAALTNPTILSKRKGRIKLDYPVEVRGIKYPDAESAYQSLKKSIPIGDGRSELMIEIIAAKLEQHPRLTEAISSCGGITWLETYSHQVTKKGSYWEGVGLLSPFIVCLIKAYSQVFCSSMDILKFQNGYIGKKGLVYCGRPKTKRYSYNQLLIGLGNPFSWKNDTTAKFQVTSLQECIKEYRKWLFKLLVCFQNQELEKLQPWETDYLKHVLELAGAIALGEVSGLVCWCIEQKNYTPVKGSERCHAQVLYSACLWLIKSSLVKGGERELDLSSLWQ